MSLIAKGKLSSQRFLIPYRVYGAGVTIVCVNGTQQTMAVWHSSVLRFSKTYRFILYDAPGTAKDTIVSGSKEVSVSEQIKVLHDLIQHLCEKDQPLYMVGASWGSVIAAVYAASYPSQVDRLILGSFSLRPSAKMLSIIDTASELYHSGESHKGAELIIEGFGQKLPEAHKKRMIKQFSAMKQHQFDCFYQHLIMIAKTGPITDYVDLRNIKARTLIINGEEDQLLDDMDTKEILQLIPHAELRIVSDTGHFLHLEKESIFDIYAEHLKS